MSRITKLSTGSTTLVKNAPGTLYAVHVFPVNGASVQIADIATAPNPTSGGFDFSITSTVSGSNWSYRTQVYGSSSGPEYIDFKGLQFSQLTVSATSSARVDVITD